MKKRDRSYNTVFRYALFQLPGLVVLVAILILAGKWTSIPSWFLWVIVLLWVIKDAIMFPIVWRAYEKGGQGGAEAMKGMKGIARERLDPSGYIHIHGEMWHGELIKGDPPVEKGEDVIILGHRGFTLIVGNDKRRSSIVL